MLDDWIPLDRDFFDRPVLEVAPDLLGTVLVHDDRTGADGPVAVRLTEVEAYGGAEDPGSHSYRGRTPRNAVMFGPPGVLYVYFTYGMHWCANLVCGPVGQPSAVLLRAGEVVAGLELARKRRSGARSDHELARGPARLTVALGVGKEHNGLDTVVADSPVRIGRLAGAPKQPAGPVLVGVRTGVGGAGAGFPWRFCLAGEPSVSPYRPHVPKRRKPADR
ncbi:MAG: DNA-3-methyladenine glycosylase [Sporichthyaceae bacterium]|nr:DNA-3-methyladenine glycosylase [Sporichthyaceae bacterium]